MPVLRQLVAFLFVLAAVPAVQALSLGSAELQAAQRLGCVLADDALGYLNEDEFNRRFDDAVTDFSEEQVDVVYAKALGYIDGLLFGVPSGQSDVAVSRLLEYSSSRSCQGTSVETVSL